MTRHYPKEPKYSFLDFLKGCEGFLLFCTGTAATIATTYVMLLSLQDSDMMFRFYPVAIGVSPWVIAVFLPRKQAKPLLSGAGVGFLSTLIAYWSFT